jgi:hypothetical protein
LVRCETRSRTPTLLVAAVLVLGGVLCEILVGGLTGELLAICLISLGLLAVVGRFFLEVGRSEEREVERERRRLPRRPGQ